MRYCVTLFLVLITAYVDAIRPDNSDPQTDPNIIEGDIYVPPEEKDWNGTEEMRQGSDFVDKPHLKWPKDPETNVCTVFYDLNQTHYSFNETVVIMRAFEEWNKVLDGCLVLKRRYNKRVTHWIYILKATGCWSSVGKNRLPGPQRLSLGPSCLSMGRDRRQVTVMHEVTHAIGMQHEHNRLDRDNYIRVLPNSTGGEFKIPGGQVLLGEYDYYSIMHYEYDPYNTGRPRWYEVLKEGIDTDKIGKGKNVLSFSDGDVKKIKELYGCE